MSDWEDDEWDESAAVKKPAAKEEDSSDEEPVKEEPKKEEPKKEEPTKKDDQKIIQKDSLAELDIKLQADVPASFRALFQTGHSACKSEGTTLG